MEVKTSTDLMSGHPVIMKQYCVYTTLGCTEITNQKWWPAILHFGIKNCFIILKCDSICWTLSRSKGEVQTLLSYWGHWYELTDAEGFISLQGQRLLQDNMKNYEVPSAGEPKHWRALCGRADSLSKTNTLRGPECQIDTRVWVTLNWLQSHCSISRLHAVEK